MFSLSVVSWCCVSLEPLIFVIKIVYFWWDESGTNSDDSQFSFFLFSCRKADGTGASRRYIWHLGSGGGWRSDCWSGGHNMYGVQERTEAPHRNGQRSVSTSFTGDTDCGHFLQWPILSPSFYEIACSAAGICLKHRGSNVPKFHLICVISVHKSTCKEICSCCWSTSADIQLQSGFIIIKLQ